MDLVVVLDARLKSAQEVFVVAGDFVSMCTADPRLWSESAGLLIQREDVWLEANNELTSVSFLYSYQRLADVPAATRETCNALYEQSEDAAKAILPAPRFAVVTINFTSAGVFISRNSAPSLEVLQAEAYVEVR